MDVLYLGRTNSPRSRYLAFGIRAADRHAHLYIVGRTGTGKSTLLSLMAWQDITRGTGIAVFDPHGDLVEGLRDNADPKRFVYLDSASAAWRFNPLERSAETEPALLVAGLIDVFKKLWLDSWGPRLEHLLRNVLATLVYFPQATLGAIPRLLADKNFRGRLLPHIADPVVKAFWTEEFGRYSPGFRSVVVAPLQNKIGAVLTDRRLRAILDCRESSFDLSGVMDTRGVLLVNLSKGHLGEGPSHLLGSLLVSHIALRGLERAARPVEERRAFFVYLDEFQTFATPMVATMLSELRKYRVGLVLAHQYLSQLDVVVRDAVLGNVGSMIIFRVGPEDAPLLARELEPVFTAKDLLRLPNYHMYLKLMIDGSIAKPFSATTFASIEEVPQRAARGA